MLSMMSVLILWAVVPLAPAMLGVDLNIGVLYIIAAGAIGTLSIIMAGWSSNNKFALIGAFRQVAVMVSFEIPMLAALLIPTILAGSMGMNAIVEGQDHLVLPAFAARRVDLPDRGHRRTGARALRPGRRRIGTGLRFQHRIFRHEVRHVLRGRTPACLHLRRFLGDHVLRRLPLLRS
ncbi:MAG: NADH-quinone oxidoreductase subunit H [Candidatus Moduliflexus flocculans]|nr:NADH-quinone oxidoreductase subunit H [Candidatus Moduliflexus flocculans]